MKILTQIIQTAKEESKKYFQKRCQKKIERFEKTRLREKCNSCPGCKERHGYIRRGKRKRRLRTSMGEVIFQIQQIECKNCNRVYRPLIELLELKPKQIITEELLDKSIEVAIHTSYKTASQLTKSLTGESISGRKIQKGVLRKSEEIRQYKANEPPKEYKVILEDSTKGNTGKTKRGEDINVVYGITGRKRIVNAETGEIKRQLFIGDILSVTVGSQWGAGIQHTTGNVITDGAEAIQKKIRYQKNGQSVLFHRCNWHLSRMLGFSLYNDGLKTKKQRNPFVSKLALIIKHSFKNYKRYYKELIAELKGKEYFKSVKYLENAEQEFYNTKEKPAMIDGIPLLANSPIERVMREIDRRVDIGVRWSRKGLEAITRVRLDHIYINNI